MDDIRTKWSTLIDQTRHERIDLWAFLGEARPVEIQGDKLQISCPDSFHLDTFKRNRDYISQLAEKVYGGKMKLEAIISSASSPSPEQSVKETKKDDTLQHPVVQALIREFGAEQVE